MDAKKIFVIIASEVYIEAEGLGLEGVINTTNRIGWEIRVCK